MTALSMKAISIHQPWASAIALGHKTIETRHWRPKHRGLIAIHAAKAVDKALAAAEHKAGHLPAVLPSGAIVAIATLVDVLATADLVEWIEDREHALGNYAPGRFGWLLQDVRALRTPVPVIGRQSLFSISGDVLAAVEAAR